VIGRETTGPQALTGLPQLAIEIGGTRLAPGVVAALTSVRIQQRASQPAQCELLFVDPRGALASGGVVKLGASLRVEVGGRAPALFAGDITAVGFERGPSRVRRIRVRAYDGLHRLRKRSPVRALQQINAASLARELASDVGLTVDVPLGAGGPTWPYLIQSEQSDLDLLADLAARCGLYLAVRGDCLRLTTLDGEGEPLPLALGAELLEAHIELNADQACRSVAAEGWDPLSAAVHDAEADEPRAARHPAMTVTAGDLGGDDQRRLDNRVVADGDHLRALAQAELDRRVAGEVVLRGVATGDPALAPGARVQVTGMGAELEGRFVLTAVTHTIDAERGYLAELSSEPPLVHGPRAATVSALGTVTSVADPDGRGRVRVKLPALGDVETDWMQVLMLGAGPKKGLLILPAVDDRVLVSLAAHDPARGWVIGGFYGADGAPDAGIEGGAVRRFSLLSPDGHAIQLDDAAQVLRVRDSTGSYVEMSKDQMRLHAEVPLTIEAPGKAIVLRADTIDFQRG
jgi:uncharacterized protein involved in type VI secretion and phage assembly